MKFKKITSLAAAAIMAVSFCSGIPAGTESNTSFVITAEAASKLPAPTGFSCTRTSTSVNLKWKAVNGAYAYRVYKYNAKLDMWLKYKVIADTACKITDLKKNTTYYFKVVAIKQNGNSYTEGTKSKKIKVTTKKNDIPSAPSSKYTGLRKGNDGKIYYFVNGKIASGWQTVDGYTYYFDKTNYNAVTSGLKAGDNYYYFSNTGKMFTNTTKNIDGTNYTINSDGTVNGKLPAYVLLSEEGQKLVDDVITYIYGFKDPSSVKIITAHNYNYFDRYFGYWMTISAKNSFGARDSETYFLITHKSESGEEVDELEKSSIGKPLNPYGFKDQKIMGTSDGNPEDLGEYHSFKNELSLINEAISDKLSEMGY